jgi:hypothetical protein
MTPPPSPSGTLFRRARASRDLHPRQAFVISHDGTPSLHASALHSSGVSGGRFPFATDSSTFSTSTRRLSMSPLFRMSRHRARIRCSHCITFLGRSCAAHVAVIDRQATVVAYRPENGRLLMRRLVVNAESACARILGLTVVDLPRSAARWAVEHHPRDHLRLTLQFNPAPQPRRAGIRQPWALL